MITSSGNPRIKQLKKLLQKKYRTKEKQFLVEGTHLAEEAIQAEIGIALLVRSEEAYPLSVDLGQIPVLDVSSTVFKSLSTTESPQGWIAVCYDQPAQALRENGNVLIVDGVQDPGNLGTIIRTAEAANMAGIFISDQTVDPYNDKVIRATQGAIFHIPIIKADLKKEIGHLKAQGKTVVGTTMDGKRYDQREILSGEYALIVGNEGSGVDGDLLNLTDMNVSIPILGKAESLNVAVATGILIYGWLDK